MRKSSVSSITYGALFCALIGVLVYANRLLAGAIELYFFWIIPIPVIVYILKFGVKQAVVMSTAMILMTMIISGPISAGTFYVIGATIAGIFYGDGLVKGKSVFNLVGRLIIVSMVEIIITVFFAAAFFGYDLSEEVRLMGEMMLSIAEKMGESTKTGIAQIINSNKLLTIVIISYILSSVMEGVLVHLFAYIALKRLKMQTPPMIPVYEIKAPRWMKLFIFVGLLTTILTLITGVTTLDKYVYPFQVITAFICYFFGYIYIIVYLSLIIPNKRTRSSIIVILVLLSLFIPYVFIGLGILDIFTNNRKILVERAKAYAEQQNRQN